MFKRVRDILLALFLPCAVAVVFISEVIVLNKYTEQFGYDNRAALLSVSITTFSILLILFGWTLSNRVTGRHQAAGTFFGMALGLYLISNAAIIIAAFLSNAFWGDTLNYQLALTFLKAPRAAISFLPIQESEKSLLLYSLVGISTVSYILVAALSASSGRLLTKKISHPRWSKLRTIALPIASILLCLSTVVCAVQLNSDLKKVRGEPLTSFVGYISEAKLAQFDNARLAAAIEDKSAAAKYKATPLQNSKNVILILFDALRADHMSVYGYARPTTPFLSKLHSEGKLHKVDMALSTCSESYCGIASVLASRPFHELSDQNFKLHTLLRKVGYQTNFYLAGDHRAWSYLADFYGADVDRMFDYKSLSLNDMHDDQLILNQLDKIDQAQKSKPQFFFFFLMATHFNGTHHSEFEPYQPSTMDAKKIGAVWNELAGNQRSTENLIGAADEIPAEVLTALSNRYDNGVSQADAEIERVFSTLKDKGYLDNSIVVISGDHGDGLGEHGHLGHTRYLFQEDIRVPLLVFGYEAGELKNNRFATHVDIAPTILDLIGATRPIGWRGQSLTSQPIDRITIHQTRRGHDPCYATIEAKQSSLFKFIRCGNSELYFDLRNDPKESNNLIKSGDRTVLTRLKEPVDKRFLAVTNSCKTFECSD